MTAMEVGNHENDNQGEWWGGSVNEYQYPAEEELYQNEVNYNGYGWKGKGSAMAMKGKGKGPVKGGGKSGLYGKGGGKDKGGKGKGKKGGFQGECHWCGKWGHSASRCADKDEYMDWVRGGKGYGKNQEMYQKETNLMQHDHGEEEAWKTVGNPVAMLETPGRFVDICNVDKHFPKLRNRYSALSEEENDEPDREVVKMVPNSAWAKGMTRRWQKKKCEINSFEHHNNKKVELNIVDGDNYMELTIDSGAGENVMPEYMAPKTPVQHSKEQDAGVVYTAANGDTMPNRGRKVVHVTTKEGQLKSMNMQITDVNRALMSVAKICDAGHTVVFKPEGGVIRNNKTGEETKFRRENNVYRMSVKLNEVGFVRQG